MTTIRTALVTGASGFIGSALATRLAQQGVRTYGLVRSRQRPRIPGLVGAGVEIIESPTFDVGRLTDLFQATSPEVVFHLAAYGVSPADRDPHDIVDGNFGLVARLLLAAKTAGVPRFIHTGSCHEYGGSTSPGSPARRLHEHEAVIPLSTYGAAKAGSVLYATAYAGAHQLPCVTLRLFWVYGPNESPARLIPYLVDRLRRNEVVDLTSGIQIRDLLHIDDVVAAYLAAAEPTLPLSGVYNVCSGQGVTVREVAETIADMMCKPRKLLAFGQRPSRGDEAHWIVGEPQRFMSATGWRPSLSLEEGIRRTAETLLNRAVTAIAA